MSLSDVLFVIGSAAMGYFIGSIPIAYFVAHMRGVNILEVGTRNPGTMNVFRTVGKGFGLLEFMMDAAKGALPVLLASLMGVSLPWTIAAGAGAVLGHWYPLFLRFKGGIGIATGAGAAIALLPVAGAIAIVVGAALRLVWHNTSGATAVGCVAFVITAVVLGSVSVALVLLFLAVAVGVRSVMVDRANRAAPG